jgi:hypothetical protein
MRCCCRGRCCPGPGQRDDAVFHGYREAARVGEEPVRDDILSDLAPDVLVRPAEDAEQVSPADNANQASLTVDDRKPPELVRGHQASRVADEFPWARGHRRPGHEVARRELPRRCVLAMRPPAVPLIRGLAGQQICLGYHTQHHPAVGYDGKAADPVSPQQPSHVPVCRVGPDR